MASEKVLEIATAQEMFDLGARIGAQSRSGDLILLHGPLGAGKTVFVQGLGSALGFHDITSPTFVIARSHKGPLPLIHVDAYRLLDGANSRLSLDDLDLDTEREAAVTCIEWGGEESARLSDQRLEITIDREDDVRKVVIKPVGARWENLSL